MSHHPHEAENPRNRGTEDPGVTLPPENPEEKEDDVEPRRQNEGCSEVTIVPSDTNHPPVDESGQTTNDLTITADEKPNPDPGPVDDQTLPMDGEVSSDPPVPDRTVDLAEAPPWADGAGGTGLWHPGMPISNVPQSEGTVVFADSVSGSLDDSATGVWSIQPDAEAPSDTPTLAAPRGQPKDKTYPQIPGYEILAELGRGAMGVVYKARQEDLQRVVALKMVLSGDHANEQDLIRFRTEAQAIARFHHANIVQVYETGEHQGRPFFSLEFVEGGTLGDRIAEKPLDAQAAAEVVRALAEAMACAHDNGVLHRDLKPANILLTTKGVPKITDFGLAKKLEEDSLATRAGAIMGTPSYMSPEQAQGKTDKVGPAVDIYSLGAILYELLTGRPPFRGANVMMTLHQVKNEEPVSPSRLHPGLARDLETICLKCLQKESNKRYASAHALAEDLRRFLEGEPIEARPIPTWERAWKWCRRHPALAGLSVLSVVFVLSLVLGGVLYAVNERRRAAEAKRLQHQAEVQRAIAENKTEEARDAAEEAEAQHARAEKHFQQARQAVEQMLVRVGAESLDDAPRMKRVQRDLLESAATFYERFLQEDSEAPEVRWEAGRAAQKLGDIRALLKEYSKAEQNYQQALKLLGGLAAEFPSHPKYRWDLALVHNNRGTMLKDRGNHTEAMRSFRTGLNMLQQLADEFPPRLEYRRELATTYYNLGMLQSRVDPADQKPGKRKGREHLQKAITLQTQLMSGTPGSLEYHHELARSYVQLSQVQEGDDPGAAEQSIREAMKLLRQVVGAKADSRKLREELVLACNQLGLLLSDDRPREAEGYFHEGVERGKNLVADFPTVPDYKRELATCYNNLGILFLASGQRQQADRAFAQSLELKEKLVSLFPREPEYRRDLATSYMNRGLQLRTANQLDQARPVYQRAEELLYQLTQEFADVPDYKLERSRALVHLGTLQQSTSLEQADQLYHQAEDLLNELVEEYPQQREYVFGLARTRYLRANLLQLRIKGADPQSAELRKQSEQLYREAARRLKQLVDKYANQPEYRQTLASCYTNLGNLLRAAGKSKEAEAILKEGVKLLEKLIHDAEKQKAPSHGHRRDLSRLLHVLGVLYKEQKRLAEAETSHGQAVKRLKTLAQQFPQEPMYRQELANSYQELAIVLALRNQLDASRKHFLAGIALLQELQEQHPQVVRYWQDELPLQQNLTELLLAGGQARQAEKPWQRRVALRKKFASSFANVADHKGELGRTLHLFALYWKERGKLPEAIQRVREAIPHQRQAMNQAPKVPGFRVWLCTHYLELSLLLVEQGQHQSASQAITDLLKVAPSQWPQYQVAAAVMARCVALVEQDKELPEAQRKQLAGQHGDLAIRLLRLAQANGFRDAAALKKAREFEAVRGRADFQKLLTEMANSKRKPESHPPGGG